MNIHGALIATALWIFAVGLFTWVGGFVAVRRPPFWIGISLMMAAVLIWITDIWLQVQW